MSRQRQKKGRAVSGWIVLDKPAEMGSTQAVAKLRWLFGAQKAGHAGTLDPLATGILPVALGEATKTVPFVVDGTKVYRFTAGWGRETTTDDLEGETVATSDLRPSREQVEALLPRFTGVIGQVPPAFSAIKVDGERAYNLARDGETVELAPREVEIDRIEIVGHADDATTFEVECGKGTYVRALARDMGRMLGCHGHVSMLRRTEVDPFAEGDAVLLDALVAAAEACGEDREARDKALDAFLLDPGEAMEGFPRIDLTDEQATRIRLGNAVLLRGRDAPVDEPDVCAFARGKLLAVGDVERGSFQPRRVLKI